MKIEDILAEIDGTTLEDFSGGRSRLLSKVYTRYLNQVFTDAGPSPQEFLEFWANLDRQEKVNFIRAAIQ